MLRCCFKRGNLTEHSHVREAGHNYLDWLSPRCHLEVVCQLSCTAWQPCSEMQYKQGCTCCVSQQGCTWHQRDHHTHIYRAALQADSSTAGHEQKCHITHLWHTGLLLYVPGSKIRDGQVWGAKAMKHSEPLRIFCSQGMRSYQAFAQVWPQQLI